MKIDLDPRQLGRALREYEKATGKDGADILNRAGRNVGMRAMSYTPKASPAKIKRELLRGVVLFKVLNYYRKKAGKPALSGKAMSKPAKAFLNRKVISGSYIKAGWIRAVIAFGGKPRGAKLSGKGLAAIGYGKKATQSNLLAELANYSRGAGKVGDEALNQAIKFVADDMLGYAQKKMAKTAKKFSAR